MANSVGSAYLNIFPSMKGFGSRLMGELSSVNASAVGDRLGRQIGDGIDAGMGRASSATSGFSGRLSALAGVAGGVAAELAGRLLDSVMQLGGEMVAASDSAQKFASTLEFARIDDSTIKQLTASTQEYADRTVYDLADIRNATAQLASNGVDNYAQLAEAAGNLNAVAGGSAETFKSVSMVMSQTAGSGRLMTENWNQLTDAIPGASGALQDAMKAAGAFEGNFRDAMEKGEISADEFFDAVQKLGMTDVAKEAATSTATIEGAMGNLQAAVVGVGSQAIDAIKPMVTGAMSGLAEAIQGIPDRLAPIGDAIGEIGDAFMDSFSKASPELKRFGKQAQNLSDGAIRALADMLVQYVVPAASSLGDFLASSVVPAMQQFGQWVNGSVVPALQSMWTWLQENIVPILQAFGDFIVDSVLPSLQLFGQWVMENIVPALQQLWGYLQENLLPVLSDFASWISGTVVPALSDMWTWISSNIIPILQGLWDILSATVFPVLQAFADNLFSVVIPALQSVYGWIEDNIIPVLQSVGGAISRAIRDFSNFASGVKRSVHEAQNHVESAIDRIRGFFTDLVGSVAGWGREVGSNFASGLSSMAGVVARAAEAVASAAAGPLHHSTPDYGPLKHDDEWGYEMGENYARAMRRSIPAVAEAAEMLAGAASFETSPLLDAGAGYARSAHPAASVPSGGEPAGLLSDIREILRMIYEVIPEGMTDREFDRRVRRANAYA